MLNLNHTKRITCCLFMFLVLLTGCKDRKNGIALVGLDPNGQPIDSFVSPKQYSKKLGELLNSVSESTLPVLSEAPHTNIWEIRTVIVGLGLNMEAGVGPIIKVGTSPKMKLVFSNSKKPSIP